MDGNLQADQRLFAVKPFDLSCPVVAVQIIRLLMRNSSSAALWHRVRPGFHFWEQQEKKRVPFILTLIMINWRFPFYWPSEWKQIPSAAKNNTRDKRLLTGDRFDFGCKLPSVIKALEKKRKRKCICCCLWLTASLQPAVGRLFGLVQSFISNLANLA